MHENDYEASELQLAFNRHYSDDSSISLSNRLRGLSSQGEICPLFICFNCRLATNNHNYDVPVKEIPICISKNVINTPFEGKRDLFIVME